MKRIGDILHSLIPAGSATATIGRFCIVGWTGEITSLCRVGVDRTGRKPEVSRCFTVNKGG